MQNKSLLVLLSLLVLPLISFADTKQPFELPKNYSVEMVMTQGMMTMKSKLYVKGNLARHEATLMGKSSTNILRKDKGVIWTLYSEQNIYTEQPLAKNAPSPGDIPPGTWEKTGDEDADGQACEKWKADMVIYGHTVSSFWWISKKTKIPVQVEASNGIKTHWLNFKIESPDPSLFEIPANYKKSGV